MNGRKTYRKKLATKLSARHVPRKKRMVGKPVGKKTFRLGTKKQTLDFLALVNEPSLQYILLSVMPIPNCSPYLYWSMVYENSLGLVSNSMVIRNIQVGGYVHSTPCYLHRDKWKGSMLFTSCKGPICHYKSYLIPIERFDEIFNYLWTKS